MSIIAEKIVIERVGTSKCNGGDKLIRREIRDAFELFAVGVKPALITNKACYIADGNNARFIEGEYRVYETVTNVEWMAAKDRIVNWLFTRKLEKDNRYLTIGHKIEDNCELGMLMGYYTESCKRFEELLKNKASCEEFDSFDKLNFNGMIFNTCGLTKDAIEWCMEVYGDKLREVQGYIWYKVNGKKKYSF